MDFNSATFILICTILDSWLKYALLQYNNSQKAKYVYYGLVNKKALVKYLKEIVLHFSPIGVKNSPMDKYCKKCKGKSNSSKIKIT